MVKLSMPTKRPERKSLRKLVQVCLKIDQINLYKMKLIRKKEKLKLLSFAKFNRNDSRN